MVGFYSFISEVMEDKGSLVVVGTGIKVAADITARAHSYIKKADIVFYIVPNKISKQWLSSLNENTHDLSKYYEDGKSRIVTYNEMTSALILAVESGKKVCAALYGHPGVFSYVGHQAIKLLSQKKYIARMEPGVSAEDCLFADIGIDPGKTGCLSIEATQFLFYKRRFDPHALIVLWQIALIGDHTLKLGTTNKYHKALSLLVTELLKYYPKNHQVIIYEASVIELFPPRIEYIALAKLKNVKLNAISTLVIPPRDEADLDFEILNSLNINESDIKEVLKDKI